MINYIAIINTDTTPYDNYLWAVLPNYNRIGDDVSSYNLVITGIPNTNNFGFVSPNIGEVTVFRKHKQTGVIDLKNLFVENCSGTTEIVFFAVSLPPEGNFNFKVGVTIFELAGNLLAGLQYGFTQTIDGVISNWQASNFFNISVEGIYYFDVKVISTQLTVGKQLVTLAINQNGTITGGDETDNPLDGTSSGE